MVQAAIEWGKFLQILWVAPVAGIGVTFFYSFVILGTARAGDARRAGRIGRATVYGALATLAALVFLGGIAFGVFIILDG